MFSGFSFLFATRSPGSRSEDEGESIHFLEAPCCRNLLQAHAVFAHPPLFGTLQALQALLAWNIHSQTRDNIVNYEQFIDKRLKRQVFHNIYFGIKISVLLWIFHLKETLKMYFSKLMRITIWDRKKKHAKYHSDHIYCHVCCSLYFSGVLYNFVYDYGETGTLPSIWLHIQTIKCYCWCKMRSAYRAIISVSPCSELSVASILMFLSVDPKGSNSPD